MFGIGKKKVKAVEPVQKNIVPLVNSVIYKQRVKTWHYSCEPVKSNGKACAMPAYALNMLVDMGNTMLGHELALKHAESLAVVGIAPELPEAIRTSMQ